MYRSARLLCLTALLSFASAAQTVSFTSLLSEMTDRQAICRLPEPAYLCRQFSSYDRASVSPTQDWFANGDRGQYLREEKHGDRTEYVMMDAEGPGAVVRIWSANPSGSLFFYCDGEAEPRWSVDFQKLTNGEGPVAKPLSAVASRGWNCYLPIPYARHMKITSDKNDFYYQVNYRTYAPGTLVESFEPAMLERGAAAVEAAQNALADPPAPVGEKMGGTVTIDPQSFGTQEVPAAPGGAVVTAMALRVGGIGPEELPDVLRRTVLQIAFDGEDTVFVPLGDFYGSGIGLNPYRTWWNEVTADGWMTCYWPMPFEREARFTLLNNNDVPLTVDAACWVAPYTWDERSMHFGAAWRSEYPLNSAEKRDWNYITLEGQGVYVGDSLAVMNPTPAWWGEGDEKVYIDGEEFPSHFGTGTEDYYGYAWCSPDLFADPFHAQPRCDGPGNKGYTSVNRVRLLDGIPFGQSLRFDMEVWHWRTVDEAYAATTWYYGRPGLKTNREPDYDQIAIGAPPMPQTRRFAGAIEGEQLEVTAASEGLQHGLQETAEYGVGDWSADGHLWCRPSGPGGFVEIRIPAPAGRSNLVVYATKSWDYGIITFSVNGQATGVSVDCYSPEVVPTGAIDLGAHESRDGALVLRVEVTGANPRARDTKNYFGIDCVMLRPVQQARGVFDGPSDGPFGPPQAMRPAFGPGRFAPRSRPGPPMFGRPDWRREERRW